MNEAKILNAIADTMTCDKCPSPCKAKQLVFINGAKSFLKLIPTRIGKKCVTKYQKCRGDKMKNRNDICEYDEGFTIKEILEETGWCKECRLDCPNKGKQLTTIFEIKNRFAELKKRTTDLEKRIAEITE